MSEGLPSGAAAGGNFHGGGLHGGEGLPTAGAIPAPAPSSNIHDIAAATGDPHQLPSGHQVITLTAAWGPPVDAEQNIASVPKRPVQPKNLPNG